MYFCQENADYRPATVILMTGRHDPVYPTSLPSGPVAVHNIIIMTYRLVPVSRIQYFSRAHPRRPWPSICSFLRTVILSHSAGVLCSRLSFSLRFFDPFSVRYTYIYSCTGLVNAKANRRHLRPFITTKKGNIRKKVSPPPTKTPHYTPLPGDAVLQRLRLSHDLQHAVRIYRCGHEK